MEENNWKFTANRFVAFFDILGFKDLVQRGTHSGILEKLELLRQTILDLENIEGRPQLKNTGITIDQTKSFTFSDSIIFFSRGDLFADALKIIFDSYTIIHNAIKAGLAIKGAISFGEISVDFKRSLFFGQPIIDAYLLHDELQMLTAVLDNYAEVKIRSFNEPEYLKSVTVKYKANLKSGKIFHTLLRPYPGKRTLEQIQGLENLYDTAYGRPRIYIDNSLEFLRSFIASQ